VFPKRLNADAIFRKVVLKEGWRSDPQLDESDHGICQKGFSKEGKLKGAVS